MIEPMSFYLALLPVGFALPLLLPGMRCALTAPFHPYHPEQKASSGGLFSVALSVGLHRPGVTWHCTLWSPDFPLMCERLLYEHCYMSDCLTDSALGYTTIR